jgi:hypothetical protein
MTFAQLLPAPAVNVTGTTGCCLVSVCLSVCLFACLSVYVCVFVVQGLPELARMAASKIECCLKIELNATYCVLTHSSALGDKVCNSAACSILSWRTTSTHACLPLLPVCVYVYVCVLYCCMWLRRSGGYYTTQRHQRSLGIVARRV